MANPLTVAAGAAVTLNSSHSIKVGKIALVAQSATAVSMTISDLNGNVMAVPLFAPATANAEVVSDYAIPLIIPGGTNLSVTNAIVTVTGAGGTAYIYHR